jgi:hypothetical protein
MWGSHAKNADQLSERLRDQWVEFLGCYHWQCVLTLTFDRTRYSLRTHRVPEQADKAFRRLIQYINETLCGPRWMAKSPTQGVVWARVQESHWDGVLHFHAVIHSPAGGMSLQLTRLVGAWWKSRYGFARSEIPVSKEAVLRYLVKNIGSFDSVELEISHNFGKAP